MSVGPGMKEGTNSAHLLLAQGLVDLTAARLFLKSPALQQGFLDAVSQRAGDRTVLSLTTQHPVCYHFCLRILLEKLSSMYAAWTCKALLTPQEVAAYAASVDRFRRAWQDGRKPTVWVH